MKKLIFTALLIAGFFYVQVRAQQLTSEFLFDMEISLHPPQAVGPVRAGTRLIFPFKDGLVKGNMINGKILESGADWGLVLDSTTFKVDVRATIQTDDGALIYIQYWGYNYTGAQRKANAGKGDDVSSSDSYFRTAVSFETSASKYAWLNHTVAVGIGRLPAPGKVAYRIYAIK